MFRAFARRRPCPDSSDYGLDHILISIQHLTKRFGTLLAVDDLSLEIPPGEIFGFLGPNGAGKTTTVKMLAGLLHPSSGRAWVAGFDVVSQSVQAKQSLALVPDEPFVYPKLTGAEFLRFVGDLYRVPWETQKKKIPELLEMFELTQWGGELLGSYSHGMRQKVVLASVLLRDPKVLILDEPMVGLDPKSGRMVREIFKTLSRRGVALFICTHILEIAEKICHRAGIMIQGKLVAVGTLEELKKQASKEDRNLEDVFLSLTGGQE
ncbi:MAG: ABC transporter ATP-binding protein, partial [Elusimicrobia bacterium]|nr:ABC transporter ATP-binding protein [Elusimicrobiota bacterium]